ncbi:exported hypothetical protein [uncultured Stenotrophomonas sp.]|uniref:Uncharacterized protein n=1 Tax=uncultured Stenotrophomonas sp. TaxID=165438 RepID=A0A1Y5Q4E3_9GAMM|nr:exported hypothetical protein [uncultured Stenotrophomonas sp.]
MLPSSWVPMKVLTSRSGMTVAACTSGASDTASRQAAAASGRRKREAVADGIRLMGWILWVDVGGNRVARQCRAADGRPALAGRGRVPGTSKFRSIQVKHGNFGRCILQRNINGPARPCPHLLPRCLSGGIAGFHPSSGFHETDVILRSNMRRSEHCVKNSVQIV